jgi:hypothetical protein
MQKYRGIEAESLAAAMVDNAADIRAPNGINYLYFKEIIGG